MFKFNKPAESQVKYARLNESYIHEGEVYRTLFELNDVFVTELFSDEVTIIPRKSLSEYVANSKVNPHINSATMTSITNKMIGAALHATKNLSTFNVPCCDFDTDNLVQAINDGMVSFTPPGMLFSVVSLYNELGHLDFSVGAYICIDGKPTQIAVARPEPIYLRSHIDRCRYMARDYYLESEPALAELIGHLDDNSRPVKWEVDCPAARGELVIGTPSDKDYVYWMPGDFSEIISAITITVTVSGDEIIYHKCAEGTWTRLG